MIIGPAFSATSLHVNWLGDNYFEANWTKSVFTGNAKSALFGEVGYYCQNALSANYLRWWKHLEIENSTGKPAAVAETRSIWIIQTRRRAGTKDNRLRELMPSNYSVSSRFWRWHLEIIKVKRSCSCQISSWHVRNFLRDINKSEQFNLIALVQPNFKSFQFISNVICRVLAFGFIKTKRRFSSKWSWEPTHSVNPIRINRWKKPTSRCKTLWTPY